MSAPKLFTSLDLKLNYFRSETEECADGGKTCEEEMIQLAEEKEKEEKEEKQEQQIKEGEKEEEEEVEEGRGGWGMRRSRWRRSKKRSGGRG